MADIENPESSDTLDGRAVFNKSFARMAKNIIIGLTVIGAAFGIYKSNTEAVKKKTYVIVLENTLYGDIHNGTKAPYIFSLGKKGTEFTNLKATTHPSLPNYLALFSGSTQGVTNDNDPGFKVFAKENLYSRLKASGATFKEWEEGLPSIGNSVYISGLFAAKHCPARFFTNVDQKCRIPLNQFKLDSAADVNFIILNLVNDGHDNGIGAADTYLKTNPLMQSIINEALKGNCRLMITCDENDGSSGNQIYTCLIGDSVKVGTVSTAFNHYSILSWLCSEYGATYPTGAIVAPLSGWKITATVPPPSDTTKVDTTKCYKTVKVNWDSTYLVHVTKQRDSIYQVSCDTVIHSIDSIWRGIYINGTSTIAGNLLRENALIADLKKWKINSIHLYDIPNNSALANLIKRIRRETFVTDIAATASSSGTFTGTYSLWNLNQPDSSDYSSWNLEYESWNTGNTWTTNKSYLNSMFAGKTNGGVKTIEQYFGWILTPEMIAETPTLLVNTTDYGLFHDYRVGPDWTYLKGRFDMMNAAAKKAGKVYTMRIIISAEPAFSQNYLKTHSCDEFYKAVYASYKTVGYTNLKLDGYLIFHLDFLRTAQSPPNARRSNVLAPDFVNVTTKEHLELTKNDR